MLISLTVFFDFIVAIHKYINHSFPFVKLPGEGFALIFGFLSFKRPEESLGVRLTN